MHMARLLLLLTLTSTLMLFTGCKRTQPSAPWPPPGFTQPVNGLSLRLTVPASLSGPTQFQPTLAYAVRRPDSTISIGTAMHVLEFRVFRPDGTEVQPSVIRPDRADRPDQGATWSTSGGMVSTWPAPLPNMVVVANGKPLLENGKRVYYGTHTLDLWTKAWDLAPGRYLIHARFFSKSPVEILSQNPRVDPALPDFYWAGDIQLPTVEIEVPLPATQPTSAP